jgi:hypothetical protein
MPDVLRLEILNAWLLVIAVSPYSDESEYSVLLL